MINRGLCILNVGGPDDQEIATVLDRNCLINIRFCLRRFFRKFDGRRGLSFRAHDADNSIYALNTLHAHNADAHVQVLRAYEHRGD